jgi:hypothetical protein
VERSHRTLNSIIAKVVSENQRNWHEVLNFAVAAYNASSNESTKYSPNFLMFGLEVLTPFDVISTKPPPGNERSIDEYVAKLQETMKRAYQIVRRNTHVAACQRKRIYDAREKLAELTAGKFVWVYYPRAWKRRSQKWTSHYTGPFRVERRINAVMYVVKRSPCGKPMVVQVDKLKPFYGVIPGQWKRHGDGANANAEAAADGNNSSSAVAGLVADPVVAGSTVWRIGC